MGGEALKAVWMVESVGGWRGGVGGGGGRGGGGGLGTHWKPLNTSGQCRRSAESGVGGGVGRGWRGGGEGGGGGGGLEAEGIWAHIKHLQGRPG